VSKRSFSRRYESTVSKSLKVPTFNHQCLARSKFFFNRDMNFLQAISRELQIELFPPKANIITEGEMGEKMYFLHRGEVEILVGPNEHKVTQLSDGNVFGEMVLFGSGKRAATVRAVEACDCRVIHHRLFGQILKKFPDEQKFFAQVAAERLGQTKQVKQQQKGDDEQPVQEPSRRASSGGEMGSPPGALSGARRGSLGSGVKARASILSPLPTSPPGTSRRRSLVNYAFMQAERDKVEAPQALPKLPQQGNKRRASAGDGRRRSGGGDDEGLGDSSDSSGEEVPLPRPPQSARASGCSSVGSAGSAPGRPTPSPLGGPVEVAPRSFTDPLQAPLARPRPREERPSGAHSSLGKHMAARPWQEQLCVMLAAPSPRLPRQQPTLPPRAGADAAHVPARALPMPERKLPMPEIRSARDVHPPRIDVLELAARQISAR